MTNSKRKYQKISIHAPLTGSDQRSLQRGYLRTYFNPRSPYGERPKCGTTENANLDFNPRSPYGERQRTVDVVYKVQIISIHAPLTGSDDIQYFNQKAQDISIHAPLTGSDFRQLAQNHLRRNFNPRSPYGERPLTVTFGVIRINFNPRSPYGERQVTVVLREVKPEISIHAPLTGSDHPSLPPP